MGQGKGTRVLRKAEGLSYGNKDLEESKEWAPAPFCHTWRWTLARVLALPSRTWARSTQHTHLGFLTHWGPGTSSQPSAEVRRWRALNSSAWQARNKI